MCNLGRTLDCCVVKALPLDVDATTLGVSIVLQALSPHYVGIAVPRLDLCVARLVDSGLKQLLIELRFNSGDDYGVARACWASIRNAAAVD